MRNLFKIIFLLALLPQLSNAQQDSVNNLKNIYSRATDDLAQYNACRDIYNYYEETNRDSALHFADLSLQLGSKNNKKIVEAYSLANKGYQYIGLGKYALSLDCLLQSFKITEDPQNDKEESWPLFSRTYTGNKRLLILAYTHHIYAILMWQTQNKEQEIYHFQEARRISSEIGHTIRLMMADMNLGRSYLSIDKPDSALICENEAEQLAFKSGFLKYLSNIYSVMGSVYENKGDKIKAKDYYNKAVKFASEQNNLNSLSASYFILTKFYLHEGEEDSALACAMKNLEALQSLGPVTGLSVNLGTVYENIYLSYKLRDQLDSAYKYLGLALVTKDSLNKIRFKNLADFQTLSANEQLRLQNAEKEKELYQSRVRTYGLIGGLAMLLLIALILYRNNRQKQKANKVLGYTLADLKATQTQLIQSEKMASLGELTAGIAHEIQNPLNFVNNFSEVSTELMTELKNEVASGNKENASSIADDIYANLEKIVFHGKRADSIVKSMLLHSRSGSGKKELTDINNLVDEYLRLSFHGMRAKEKSFNATMETDYDPLAGSIEIMPQEIGRVFLNLFNNSFYSMFKKKEKETITIEPVLKVSTRKINKSIEIRVRDNGIGIPKEVIEKVFQPFFTTKPTGEGTGLGLSLSYDIIKAHGGELKVNTKQGEYAEFVITIPI